MSRSVVAAVPFELLELPRRCAEPDAAARAAGAATPHAGEAAAHVHRSQALAGWAAATGLRLLLAGGPAGVLALALGGGPRPVSPPAAAALLGAALGLPVPAAGGAVAVPAADPAAVGWLAAALGHGTVATVARLHPHLVGPVDGMPPAARDRANRILADRAAHRLGQAGDHRRARALRALVASEDLLLFVDPDRGRAAQVQGDLATADHVAVVVPGMGSSLEDFAAIAAMAASLRGAARDVSPGQHLAVVAWLGYDAPQGVVDVAFEDAAREGGDALVRTVAGLGLGAGVGRTVVAHSYGSTLVGAALGAGLDVDAVAVAGSPGMLAERRRRLGGTPVYAMRTPDDPVGVLEWFGTDPTDPDFGGTRLQTGEVRGHGRYFEPGSEAVRNLALVATGRAAEASVHEPGLLARAADVADAMTDNAGRPLDAAQAVGRHAAAAASVWGDALERTLPGPAGDVVGRVQDVAGDALRTADRLVDAIQRKASPDTVAELWEWLTG